MARKKEVKKKVRRARELLHTNLSSNSEKKIINIVIIIIAIEAQRFSLSGLSHMIFVEKLKQ